MNNFDIQIIPFTYRHAHLFSKLRRDIDHESDHLLAKKNERKENGIHVLVRLLLSQRRIVTFLSFHGTTDVGYVSLVFPKFAKLRGNTYLTIAVREKYRGKGIGNMLMNKAEEYAKTKGIRRIELEVFGGNTKAIELYTKRNYEIEGIKKEAVQTSDGFDDIVIMVKRLA